MTNIDKYHIAILKKMYLRGIWGGRHTDIRNVIKGFPKSEIGNIKIAAKELIRKGFLVQKKQAMDYMLV